MQLEPLLPDAQPLDQTSISLVIVFPEIIEKPSPLTYQLEETPAGVVILDVDLEVLREMIDALAQQGNLNFRRARIGLMEFEMVNNFFSLGLSNPHLSSVHHLSFFFSCHFSIILLCCCKAEHRRGPDAELLRRGAEIEWTKRFFSSGSMVN